MLEELHEKSLEDPNFLAGIHALMVTLSNTPYKANNFCYWNSMLRQPGWHTYIWRSAEGQMVGMASISFTLTPKAYVAHIHDVVVLRSHRGQGIARALTESLIRLAKNFGANFIELTSGRKRKAARAMYEQLGFKKRDTGVYRLELHD